MAVIVLLIKKQVHSQLIRLCRQNLPREACGVLTGRGGKITRIIPLVNASAFPTREFVFEDGLFRSTLRETEKRNEYIMALFHSHPSGGGPSVADLELARQTGLPQIILSFKAGVPVVMLFTVEKKDRRLNIGHLYIYC